mmetsp:Transcript_53136/g.124365  ORF Transcript_53136/g.124365 Transcript_53136/m.124365 type:complete len:212 (+) Transcript_53136:634-1269(+)
MGAQHQPAARGQQASRRAIRATLLEALKGLTYCCLACSGKSSGAIFARQEPLGRSPRSPMVAWPPTPPGPPARRGFSCSGELSGRPTRPASRRRYCAPWQNPRPTDTSHRSGSARRLAGRPAPARPRCQAAGPGARRRASPGAYGRRPSPAAPVSRPPPPAGAGCCWRSHACRVNVTRSSAAAAHSPRPRHARRSRLPNAAGRWPSNRYRR